MENLVEGVAVMVVTHISPGFVVDQTTSLEVLIEGKMELARVLFIDLSRIIQYYQVHIVRVDHAMSHHEWHPSLTGERSDLIPCDSYGCIRITTLVMNRTLPDREQGRHVLP